MSNPKRNLKEVGAGPALAGFVPTKELKEGDSLNGLYRGSFKSGPYNSTTHKIEVEAPTAVVNKEGEDLTAKAGELVGISGGKQLDTRLAQIPDGTYVSLVYKGFKKITTEGHPFKGSKSHNFTVLADLADGFDPADAVDGSEEEGI